MQAKALFLSLLLPSFILCQDRMLIIDTGNNDPHIYRNFMLLADAAGFKAEAKPFYQLSPASLDHYNSILLNLDGSFLVATAKELATKQTIESPLLKHIFSLIAALSKRSNSTIGIMVPVPNKKSVAILSLIKQILAKLGLNAKNKEIALLLDNALNHLMHSDASKSYGYDTALLYKKDQHNTAQPKQFEPLMQAEKLLATSLPRNQHFLEKAPELTPLYPLGFYFKNQQTGNHFFITSQNYVHVTDINEPFMLNPVDSNIRKALLKGQLSMLNELYTIQNKSVTRKHPSIPYVLTDAFSAEKKKQTQQQRKNSLASSYNWITCEGIACGWMHLDPFYGKEETAAEHILQSGQNMLWLQLRPEWYLSDNCCKTEDEKRQFFQHITDFTTALNKKAQELNKKAPHIFVGMELSGNFAVKPVNEAPTTAYGTNYSKIPAPLDFKHYWKKELVEVFDRFHTHWQQSLGSGLPLAGVFLDFEMYHAQDQTGQYSSLMDFSDLSWHLYNKKINNTALAKLKTTNERINYLLQSNQLTNYFSFLEQEARKLGKTIKDHLHQTLPEGIIAAYNINLPHSWFYKGILAGLSSPQQPLILATFNNDYYTHYDWLTKNNIHLLHLPVVLFSKLRNKSDFNLINRLSAQHDGVWFNRYSWLEQPKSADGSFDYGVESSPLSSSLVIKLMNKHIKQMQAVGPAPVPI